MCFVRSSRCPTAIASSKSRCATAIASEDERRLLHDFIIWRRDARLIVDLGAYRTIERNLIRGNARPEPVTMAETTASAFRVARVPPLLGRPLLDADEQPGAPPVVVLGYSLWQQQFGGRAGVVGETIQLGREKTTVVGVMPEGFAFPVNHRLWVPLQRLPAGLRAARGAGGARIRTIGAGSHAGTGLRGGHDARRTRCRRVTADTRPSSAARPGIWRRVSRRSFFARVLVTHLPIALVLIVACANVGTLIYARTATRDAEIAVRYALGATRGRIVTQLFVEALVLASAAAVVGLAAAHWALQRGVTLFYSESGALPFWVHPGLKLPTVFYAPA